MIWLKKEIMVFIGLLAIVLASGCVQQSPVVPLTEYGAVALEVKANFPDGNCYTLSHELNNRLLALGYDSKVVDGDFWEFNCERDPVQIMKCYASGHSWVEINIDGELVWIESTIPMVVPDELKNHYVEWVK